MHVPIILTSIPELSLSSPAIDIDVSKIDVVAAVKDVAPVVSQPTASIISEPLQSSLATVNEAEKINVIPVVDHVVAVLPASVIEPAVTELCLSVVGVPDLHVATELKVLQ